MYVCVRVRNAIFTNRPSVRPSDCLADVYIHMYSKFYIVIHFLTKVSRCITYSFLRITLLYFTMTTASTTTVAMMKQATIHPCMCALCMYDIEHIYKHMHIHIFSALLCFALLRSVSLFIQNTHKNARTQWHIGALAHTLTTTIVCTFILLLIHSISD